MISKKIHQIWLGPKNPPLLIMDSWKRYCEKYNWEYKLWTEQDITKLNLKNYKIFEFYKNNNQINENFRYQGMSDIARLEIINQYGGFYFDCDFYSWQNNIEEIVDLNHNMAILCTENKYPINYTREKSKSWLVPFAGFFDSSHFVCNGVFYANPKNNILTDTIDNLNEVFNKNKNINWENYNLSIADINWMTCGCWQLSHFSKKYPFILLSTKFIFSSIEYALGYHEKYEDIINNKFKNQIICSYIDDHNENRLNHLSNEKI